MADKELPKDRQRRALAYLLLGVGLVNLVVGVVAGATVTIAVSVFMLVAGGALLVSSLGPGNRPPPA